MADSSCLDQSELVRYYLGTLRSDSIFSLSLCYHHSAGTFEWGSRCVQSACEDCLYSSQAVCLRRLFVLVSSRKDCPTDSKDATPSLPVHLDLPGIVMSLSELQVWQPEFTSSQIQSTEKHNSRQFQTKQTSKNQPCQQSKHNSQQTHRATPRLVWI